MVLTQERVVYTGTTDLSHEPGKSGSVFRYIVFHSPSSSQLLPHVCFYAQEAIYVTGLHVTLLDGGTVSGAAQYVFDIAEGTAAALRASSLTPWGIDLQGSIASAHTPLVCNATFGPRKISADTWFGVALRASAALEADCGHGLTVTVHARRFAE